MQMSYAMEEEYQSMHVDCGPGSLRSDDDRHFPNGTAADKTITGETSNSKSNIKIAIAEKRTGARVKSRIIVSIDLTSSNSSNVSWFISSAETLAIIDSTDISIAIRVQFAIRNDGKEGSFHLLCQTLLLFSNCLLRFVSTSEINRALSKEACR